MDNMVALTLQLYSARHSDLNNSLEIIATAGYKTVGAYGENLKEPDSFHQALQAHGLTTASAPAQYFIVEHDNPSNLKRFAENSYTTIQGWNW